MKAKKILLIILLIFPSIDSQNIEIQNGETIDLKSQINYITYDFWIPANVTIYSAFILYKYKSNSPSKFSTIEDDIETEYNYNPNYFSVYSLTSVGNKTITFKISFSNDEVAKFTLLDLSKEINVNFDQFLSLMSSFFVPAIFSILLGRVNFPS